MATTSPTARSTAHLRRLGYLVETVERWLPVRKIRKDLLGCADLLALKEGEPPLLVQVTTRSNQAARLTKAVQQHGLRVWLRCGGRFEVHGWAKVGPRGGRKLWAVTCRPVTLADLPAQTAQPAGPGEVA